MSRTSLLAVLLLTGALCAAPLEPRSDHGEKCRNTVQGRSHLLDEKGWLCTLDSIDWETGCCPPARAAEEQYSCRSCEPDISCCTVYEHCVGCCLKPSNDGQRKAAMAAARHKKTFEKAVAAGDDFEFCRASCRTSSMSIARGCKATCTSRNAGGRRSMLTLRRQSRTDSNACASATGTSPCGLSRAPRPWPCRTPAQVS